MGRSHVIRGFRGWVAAAGALLLAATGCTSSGNSFTLFPVGNQLIDTAKDVRATTPAPLPRELEKRPLEAYIVEPGDGLLIVPSELDSPVRLPSDQVVLPDGSIDLGKFGRIMVAGKTVPEIEGIVNRVVADKSKDKDKEKDQPPVGFINVRLVNRVSKVYYVLGEVNTPGSFPLQGRETVLDGILAAGGLNAKASRKNIILVRPSPPDGCRTVLAICYPEIVQLGDTSTNYQLRPGDRIYVATAGLCEGLTMKRHPCVTCTGPHNPCDLGGCAPAGLGAPAAPGTTELGPVPGAGVGPATQLP
jgi:polysaccharide export outer membrane protein